MAIIPLDELQPGMTLADAARDATGRVLLAAGIEVEERHLKIMRTWGVVEVNIQGEGEAENPKDISPETRKAAVEYVKQQFRGFNPAQFGKELMRRTAQRKAMRLATGFDSEDQTPISVYTSPEEITYERCTIDPEQLFDDVELAALPTIFNELIDVINNPRSSSAAIGKVVSKDTSLSARLLKIVNSPFYGFPSRIDTISRAVTVIGTRQLTTLAVGICAMDIFKDVPSDVVDMESFWRHSIGTGLICRILATLTGLPSTERLFVSGLLHDIGHLVLFKYRPEQSRTTVVLARSEFCHQHEAERRVFGVDHARLGADLLREWKLPPTLEGNVRHHNDPEAAADPREAAVVCVANAMAYAMEYGNAGECRMPRLPSRVPALAQLSPAMIGETMRQADLHYRDLTRMFLNG